MLNVHRRGENRHDGLIRPGVVFLSCPQGQPHNTTYCDGFIYLLFQHHTYPHTPIYLPSYPERLMSTSSSCLLYFTQTPRAKTDRAVQRLGDKKNDTKRREMAIKKRQNERRSVIAVFVVIRDLTVSSFFHNHWCFSQAIRSKMAPRILILRLKRLQCFTFEEVYWSKKPLLLQNTTLCVVCTVAHYNPYLWIL